VKILSYYIELQDPVSHNVIEIEKPHYMFGCNIQIGGSKELSLSITYNYSSIYRKVMGDNGINIINGKTGAESIKILENAIRQLNNDVSSNYWDATEGNAKRPLMQLKKMAEMKPDGIWQIY